MIAYSACVSVGVKGLSEGVLRELEEPGREGLFAPITPTNQNTAHSLICEQCGVDRKGNLQFLLTNLRYPLCLGIKEPAKLCYICLGSWVVGKRFAVFSVLKLTHVIHTFISQNVFHKI